MRFLCSLLLAGSVAALATGCGAMRGRSTPGADRTASAMFTVRWPERSRLIPLAAESIKVVIRIDDQTTVTRTVDRPAQGDSASVRFELLPVGTFTVTATAHPQPGGAGVPQASGSVSLTTRSSQNTAFTVTMASTIDRIAVDPPTRELLVGGTGEFVATARNGAGEVVLVGTHAITWTSANAGVARVDAATGVVTAVAPGETQITATEAESHRTGQATVTVTSAAGTITGRVTNADNAPLAGVRVVTSDGTHEWTATTGTDGRYVLSGVTPGQRVVTFSLQGNTTSLQVAVSGDSGVTLNATLQPFAGQVTGPPVITVNQPNVDEASGLATVSGTITQLDANAAVIIVNGDESIVAVGGDGAFQTVVVLRTGTNTIYVRAANAFGTAVSDPIVIEYQPATGDFYFRVTLAWDGEGDVDLHTWDPAGGHSSYNSPQITSGFLDVDNTSAYGPENFTCQTLIPGRYAIGVDSYAAPAGRRATIRVTINQGPNAGRSYVYGPYEFTEADGNSAYPVTGNTGSWWRPVDVVVGEDGSIAVATPDTGTACNRGRGRTAKTGKR